ncbi:glycosyltransferase family protein [Haloarcula halophila]|uniref:glycosyltransferase family protein n=1 Tax=Haloarcula TaxID=2237 RepID=UPI0023E39AD5|nr:glycosyltransferase family protein [Halomicroarcula sp. DFY41]
MDVLAIIQARMGSSRLPGKMMLPLAGTPVIERVIARTKAAERVDEVIVATSDQPADDILERYAQRAGVDVFRGSETDVLERLYRATETVEPDTIVRMCGDRPLIPPEVTDGVVESLEREAVDYVSNSMPRTFPLGWGCEAFTRESFKRVRANAETTYHREHVTPYYREFPEEFDLENVTSTDVFDDESLQNRVERRLTLDHADDYELIREVYDHCSAGKIIPSATIMNCVDQQELYRLNEHLVE